MSVVLIGISLLYSISQITSTAYLELYVKLSLQQQVNCQERAPCTFVHCLQLHNCNTIEHLSSFIYCLEIGDVRIQLIIDNMK